MTEWGRTNPGLFSALQPGRRPGVHVEGLKVAGDISPLPEILPPPRSDEHGFLIKSGMTEWGRTNPGFFSALQPGRRPGVHVPLLWRHPGRRPGFHVEGLKVAGDISPLPEILPPPRSDEHGFLIKSGMTEWGRTNPGLFSALHPGRRPGFHVEGLKIAGDISHLPEILPPSRSDEHGFLIKSGMTEWGRTNPGSFSARHPGPGSSPG
jgi:hypothetical protein